MSNMVERLAAKWDAAATNDEVEKTELGDAHWWLNAIAEEVEKIDTRWWGGAGWWPHDFARWLRG